MTRPPPMRLPRMNEVRAKEAGTCGLCGNFFHFNIASACGVLTAGPVKGSVGKGGRCYSCLMILVNEYD